MWQERWNGIKKLLILQWRIIALTLLLIIQSIYFPVILWPGDIKQDNATTSPEALNFGLCLVLNRGDKTKCLEQSKFVVANGNTILAGIGLMAVSFPYLPPQKKYHNILSFTSH